REHEGPAEVLGLGAVARLRDEVGEVLDRHRAGVDPEGEHGDLPDGAIAVGGIDVGVLPAHREGTPGEHDEPACARASDPGRWSVRPRPTGRGPAVRLHEGKKAWHTR